ncbi:MerR family transcriptional regulator [Pseudidiomarina salinarum]|uniref:MerR family transcriptional regulator n=1 Tax=Pseudidiomarina salinarum TaxID=435908 RepID=A0A094IXE4_9GAMM|nr:Cu(I)-responsive transcriptional regulator [Pseudidiomarina salinarum]KFZ30524.1 MerR family transcriptional regulator [Pseudidiomarina salinarum]RUO69034.1 Cu(I)-responsive transcriptional regulator [Pseudidiomarina salinarum]
MAKPLTIGEAAALTGVSAKMIRYYEEIGMLPAAARTESGYRLYNGFMLQQLGFIRQARNLGFSLEEIQSLVKLWRDPCRESREVKAIAEQHLADISQKIAELNRMQQALQQLAADCRGDSAANCAILDAMIPEHLLTAAV